MMKRFVLQAVALAVFAGAVGVTGCSNSFVGDAVMADDSQIRAVAPSWPVVKRGETSAEVRALQYLLRQRGYSVTADSIFGAGTETAVKSFQSANGLTADGVVGSATWPKLLVTVRSGSNNEAVKAVQHLLNSKYGRSLVVDGAFGAATDSALKSFQSSKGITADGIAGSTTWQFLVGRGTSSGGDFWDQRKGSWLFPVSGSILDINGGARFFGANRDGGARAHAGVDIVPVSGPGAAVRAMTSGTVLAYYHFYAGTYALEVKNDDGTIIRYGEITSTLRPGARVSRGQNIGTIIRNTSGGSYMLHLEVYMGTTTGSLTNSTNKTYKYVPYKNYQRRSDLINPMGVIKLR